MSSSQDDLNRHRSVYLKSKEYPENKQVGYAEKKEGLKTKNKDEPENLNESPGSSYSTMQQIFFIR